MRLYLSSHRMGDSAGALLAMLGNAGAARAAVIANGFDGCSAMAREIYRAEVFDPQAVLAAHGIAAESLDLRAYFGDGRGSGADSPSSTSSGSWAATRSCCAGR